jgi:flagellar biosynthetic protein FlhB
LFAWLAWTAIRHWLPSIKMLGAHDVRAQIAVLLDVSLDIGIRVAILMAVLAVADYAYQWWEFHKKLRMTPHEMKEETKEREGNPLIRQRQRSLQMQRARARMMANVPKASVVVTNPTHFAVALRYDRTKAPAPYVVAKGADLIAERIREIAREHGVPIVENKPLARALWRQVKVGRVIPNEFFKAVAEVLAFVHWLKVKRRAGASPRATRTTTSLS